jgi:CHAT domain-containing protein
MPYGWLYYLPFSSLARENADGSLTFFVEEKCVAYLTHQEVLNLVANLPQAGKERLVAFANPDGTLPGAEEEVARIGRLYDDPRLLVGAEATLDAARRLPADCTIVHFACHGKADAGDLTNSFLQLADGRLTQSEIYGLGLRAKQTRTVVLSACETFIGSETPGLEVIGLADAFATAGASTIVASLWQVSDESTQALMSEFYRQMQAPGTTKAEALRQAQLSILGHPRYTHPRYWAGFILMGEWR